MRLTVFVSALIALGLTQTAPAIDVNQVLPHPDWVNALKPQGEPGPELVLAESGEPSAAIVIPASPTTQETRASKELFWWFEQITGAQFDIVHEGETGRLPKTVISVGRTRMLEASSIPQKAADLGDEGYGIGVEPGVLYLFGGKTRGPLNAVFAFLEEDLGCRWYVHGTATIPHSPSLKVAAVPRTSVPAFTARRDPYYSDAGFADWSLRNRTLSHAVYIPPDLGGYPRFPMHFVHTYNLLMPPDEFFDAHPEYYAEIDGVRQPSQLCPTNPDVQRIMTERVLARLRSCPDCNRVDVSPNDWRGYCECERCSALDKAEGSYAASLLQLVNHVADAVAKVRPEVRVTTLAYLGTYMPPKTVRPRPNVQITLCTDSVAWDFPLLPIRDTVPFWTALEAWSKTGASITIWDYAIDFPRYLQPLPNFESIAMNLRDFADHGVTGVFEQGSHGGNFGVDRCRVRAWVWSKLMWDPGRDSDALVKDFYYGFFGKAGEPLYEYNEMLRGRWEKAHTEWKSRHPERVTPSKEEYREVFYPTCVDFGAEYIAEATPLFGDALQAAGENDALVKRIEYEMLPLYLVRADNGPWWDPWDPKGYLTMLNEFERIALREDCKFLKEAYGGPDRDRLLLMWRAMSQINPDEIHFQELSNEWKFRPDPDGAGVEQEWFAPDLDETEWGTVRSDLGHRGWESQGYAEYTTGYGWYRQTFDLPDNVSDLPNLRLFFGAVDEQAEIWINGKKALSHTTDVLGLSKDFLWNMPFLFDPVQYLKPGEPNQLTVRVYNDLHVGGIWKPVWLTWGTPVRNLDVYDEFLSRLREYRENKE